MSGYFVKAYDEDGKQRPIAYAVHFHENGMDIVVEGSVFYNEREPEIAKYLAEQYMDDMNNCIE